MNPFYLVDDGFHLLRRLSADAWLIHLAGGLPFLLALLWSATETGILYTPEKGLANSLLCSVTFLMLQFWRARFAAKLEMLIQPEGIAPWNLERIARCFCVQAVFQSTRFVVVPIAALLTFPYASVVAFFQNVALFSTRKPLSLRTLTRKASFLATPNQRQLWLVIALLSVIVVVVFLNLLILTIALPALVKSLMGIENQFTRGTGQAVSWRVVEIALGGTWLITSPLAQAVFVQRMYLLEARTTGADLLAALRRPLAGAFLALLFCAGYSGADVPPQEIEKNIRHVLSENQYSWHKRVEQAAGSQPDLLDRMVEQIRSALHAIGDGVRWIGAWLRQLFDTNSEKPENDRVARAPKSVRFILLVLTFAIAVVSVLIFLRRGRRKTSVNEPELSTLSPNLEDETLQAVSLPEHSWIALAQDFMARSDYRLALRALYLAMLAHLGDREILALGNTKTNRDYIRELYRRIPDEQVNTFFRDNIRAFESSWYGKHATCEANLLAFRQNLEALRAYEN